MFYIKLYFWLNSVINKCISYFLCWTLTVENIITLFTLLRAEKLCLYSNTFRQIKVNNSAHSLYSNIYKRRENLFESSITCEHTLIDQNVIKQSSNENLEATCVSWSSSGASVAVSYGTNENISWSDSR